MTITTFALRLLAAMLAGGFIGMERQRSRKSAGIRTNTLVAIGACMYVLISVTLTAHDGTDPSRIIGQIVTGIGFLGAGVIIHHKGSVQGLTTAATVWCSAALGSMAGLGLFWETLICTLAIWFVNIAFKTDKLLHKNKDQHVDSRTILKEEEEERIEQEEGFLE